jgi:LemA protein
VTAVWITVALVAGLALWVAFSYNRFVNQRQLLADSWSTVDTELQRRYDLVPNLVATVGGYAGHERRTLEAVIAARTSAVAEHGTPEAQAEAENLLVSWLRHLFVLVEAYPDLKASTSFLDLQQQLVHTEDRIQAARRIYNGNVRDLNRRVQQVPSALVAKLFGIEGGQYFEVEAAVRARPGVQLAP